MIGWLSGRVVGYVPNGAILVDVCGVGYEVHAALADAPLIDDSLELYVYTVVRQDAIQLFGFATFEDRAFFELLLATPGVGPTTALGALRALGVAELARAIENDDVKGVAAAPGIGLKTASRIVLELKGKIVLASQAPVAGRTPVQSAVDEALRALGYGASEVREALGDVELPEDESAALRTALQLLRRS